MRLAERLWNNPALSGPYNFGPKTNEVIKVSQLVELARRDFGVGPELIQYGCNSDFKHEAKFLALEITKSSSLLDLKPIWSVSQAIQKTVHWYKQYFSGIDPTQLCREDIDAYEKNASEYNHFVNSAPKL
jgi:CDP-glucose 4,6-dehydratase